jgi:AmmeMemoRadiSam system protein A
MSLPPSPLPEEEKRQLLALARKSIEAAVSDAPEPEAPASARRAGVFVSLHLRGRLRGCIGIIEPTASLPEEVIRCAASAALEDPRFPAVSRAELPELEIEISVLSPLAPITPEEIEPGRHGLFVTQGPFRGLLLPQVATQFHWSRQRFLEETCLKAGLPRDAWRDPSTKIFGFTAEVFSEKEFPSRQQLRAS